MTYQIDSVTAYINAGGRGTRISPAVLGKLSDPVIGISKALLEIGFNRTLLIDHHIHRLIRADIPNIVVGVGDHTRVKDYVDDTYKAHSNVYAYETPKQRGTGGDLISALHSNVPFEPSLLINNVDTILDIDEHELIESHRSMNAGMTIALTSRKGVPNEGAFIVGERDAVLFTAEASTNNMSAAAAHSLASWRGSSTGTLVVEAELVHEFAKTVEPEQEVSLYREIVGYVLGQQALYAFNNEERYFLDVGTVDAWGQAQADAEVIQSLITLNEE
jgi:NDP-sugar pyrophosphorylase family protein